MDLVFTKIDHYQFRQERAFAFRTGIKVPKFYSHNLVSLHPSGLLVTEPGFLWDGVSHPLKSFLDKLGWEIDTLNTIVPAYLHDCGYYLGRNTDLPYPFKEKFDHLLHDELEKRHHNKIETHLWLEAVESFGDAAWSPRIEDQDLLLVAR